MLKKIDWESRIGRRLPLRDLHVFSTVLRLGSMAKAAQRLGVSAPAVSEVIADLEYALGVRLLDRHPQGVEATVYGAALDRRSVAAFDELRQSIRDIESLADPASGELRIGCPESISAAILQPIMERFTDQYPRVVLDVDTVNTLSFAQKLRERELDVVLARGGWPLEEPRLVSDFKVETLFEDELAVAVGCQSPWAAKRKVDIADLRNERWILTTGDTWNYQIIARAFRRRGVDMPKISIRTISVHLRANMTATGRFVATFPRSVLVLYADRFALKILPIDLPNRTWPIKIATLKDRTLSPVAERFIACARAVASSLVAGRPKRSGFETGDMLR
jgi:DNA-binding transcriptional LysR family regulator